MIAVDLDHLGLATLDLAESCARFAALLDDDGVDCAGGVRCDLGAESLGLVDGAALAARYRGVASPVTPWVAAASFTVADMGALVALLAANGGVTRPLSLPCSGIAVLLARILRVSRA